MNRQDPFREPFRLHDRLVRPDLNRISGPDGAVQIEPRVMAVLLALAARPGAVVTRLELLDAVWGDTVVGEEILTRAVSELRRACGDDARRPAYIETIRNHGYRLIAPVVPAASAADAAEAPSGAPPDVSPNVSPDVSPAPTAGPEPGRRGLPAAGGRAAPPVPGSVRTALRWRLALALILVMALIVAALQMLRRGGTTAADTTLPAAVPLTSYPGREYHPALSPDGTRVAFAWSGADGGRAMIHVKQRGNETPLRLDDRPGWAAWPAWSPDGQSVAFVQTTDTVSAVCIVPSLGGAVRRVLRVADLVEGLDWSPDGRHLAFGAFDREAGRYRISLFDLETLTRSPLPIDRPDNAGDMLPRFSPDGRRLAWIGTERTGGSGIFVAPVGGGEPRRVVFGLDRLQGLAWTPDGRALVYAAAPAGAFALWRVAVAGGAPQALTAPGVFAWNPTIARQTGDLVFEQVTVDQDLWRVRVLDRDKPTVRTEPLLTSTRWEFGADYRPDGQGLAFVSARGGWPEVWLADADGGDPRRLTELEPAAISNVRWSPDGSLLAGNVVADGESRIFVADPAGGAPRRLSTGFAREIFGAWDAAGDALLVGADDGDGWQIHRLPLAGGPATRLTRAGGLVAQEAADRATLYYMRPDRPGLWRRSPAGRLEPELVLPDLLPRDRFNWLLRDGRIVWVLRSGAAVLLAEHDPTVGRTVLLAELPGCEGSGLAAAPGSDTFLYPHLGAATGDLMLVPAGFAAP